MQVRDGPNGMTRNPKKQVMNLGQLMRGNRGSVPHWMEVPVRYDIMSSIGEGSS